MGYRIEAMAYGRATATSLQEARRKVRRMLGIARVYVATGDCGDDGAGWYCYTSVGDLRREGRSEASGLARAVITKTRK